MPSGRVVVADPGTTDFADPPPPLTRSAPTGVFPVEVALAEFDGHDTRVACARVRFAARPAVRWEPALFVGQAANSGDGSTYGVDTGMGCFFDQAACAKVDESTMQAWGEALDRRRVDTWTWHVDEVGPANVVMSRRAGVTASTRRTGDLTRMTRSSNSSLTSGKDVALTSLARCLKTQVTARRVPAGRRVRLSLGSRRALALAADRVLAVEHDVPITRIARLPLHFACLVGPAIAGPVPGYGGVSAALLVALVVGVAGSFAAAFLPRTRGIANQLGKSEREAKAQLQPGADKN